MNCIVRFYAYVGNDPTDKTDPTGMTCQDGHGDCPPHQQNVNDDAVGNTTVGNLSRILTNEIGSLRTPRGGNSQELDNGANAIANALINNAHRTRPNAVAPDTGRASMPLARAMQGAFRNRTHGGVDPVHGRTFYGTSHLPPTRLHSRPIGHGRQTVYEHFGPFHDNWSRRRTWIYIYNNPQQHRRHRQD